MSSNIFDLFNSSKILDKHGKKIHLKIAKGSITWDKLGDDVKGKITSTEALINTLYEYVRQIVIDNGLSAPDMNFYKVFLYDGPGITYIPNTPVAFKGQSYEVIMEFDGRGNYVFNEPTVTMAGEDEGITITKLDDNHYKIYIETVIGTIEVHPELTINEAIVELEDDEDSTWLDSDKETPIEFFKTLEDSYTVYLAVPEGWTATFTYENCTGTVGAREGNLIPVTISNYSKSGARVIASAMSAAKDIDLSGVIGYKVFISEDDGDFEEIESSSTSYDYGTKTAIKLVPDTNYRINTVTAPTANSNTFSLEDNNSYYLYTINELTEDVTIVGNALANPKVTNNTQGFSVTINGTSIDRGSANAIPYKVNTPLTIVLTIPNDKEYSVKTQPSITGISGATFTQSGNTYTASITIGESDITINGIVEEVKPKIYYGVVPKTVTGFNITKVNNGEGTVNELLTKINLPELISSEKVTETDSDVPLSSFDVVSCDYVVCLIDSTLSNKKSMVYAAALQQFGEYYSGFGDNYCHNGESITYSYSNHTYKVYCLMAQSSTTVTIAARNKNQF